MFLRLLSRSLRWLPKTTRRRRPSVPRHRPLLEPLEERVVLNNRFVVPVELPADNLTTFHSLSQALTTTGVASGDIIQIEPNSSPGTISDSDLPAVTNLTIRGHPAFPAAELPAFSTFTSLTIDSNQAGFTLQNVNLILDAGLAFNANGTISSSRILNLFGGITLNGTSAAILRDNLIISHGSGTSNGLVDVFTTAGGQNLLSGNTIIGQFVGVLLRYRGSNTVTDRVVGNTLVGDLSAQSSDQLVVDQGVSGLTIQDNTFREDDLFVRNILVNPGAQNIRILDNTFQMLSNSTTQAAVRVQNGSGGTTTSVVLARNVFQGSGKGTGIDLNFIGAGTFITKVEGNDFRTQIGVFVNGTSSAAGIDLGGGSQGSLGGNNFRSFTTVAGADAGAIVCTAGSAVGSVQAQGNLFRVADPEFVIRDNGDSSSLADVMPTGNLTGKAAFVQALYQRFLRRTGNVNDPNDAGFWVNRLNTGTSAATVADSITRSRESLGLLVDGLYRRFLQREADSIGRDYFVNLVVQGSTLENISRLFMTSPEYLTHFGSDRAFVLSLYQKLLRRSPTQSEIDAHVATLPGQGRAGVANAFLTSAEYRGIFVRQFYTDLLRRGTQPSNNEVGIHVGSGSDLLSLMVLFAGSNEFQTNG